MLIPSHRHTEADLSLWRQYEEADLMHHVSAALIDRSIAMIERWDGDYVSCSWGKDSVTMLDLVVRSGRSWPVVWVRFAGRDNPDCESVRDAFLARHSLDYHERVFDYDLVRDRGLHWKAVADEFGGRKMTGIRGSESSTRMLSVSKGAQTRNTLRPLAWWTNADVFAYLAQNDLPVHPAYAMLGGGRWPREHLRTHSIGGISGAGMGRREWEREYYGDVLARIAVPQL